ncbi:hypothetical protein SAMN04488524_3577 [Pedobacter africanus]|uniref:Uncharacterized protein n=1 Tax=Pedobacter africanus TaxID=151894 RepID=A0A1W2DCF2_9SPHI|nr:hypothetical protein SAMN04488524_3577 [Pedobacter africanus]
MAERRPGSAKAVVKIRQQIKNSPQTTPLIKATFIGILPSYIYISTLAPVFYFPFM